MRAALAAALNWYDQLSDLMLILSILRKSFSGGVENGDLKVCLSEVTVFRAV